MTTQARGTKTKQQEPGTDAVGGAIRWRIAVVAAAALVTGLGAPGCIDDAGLLEAAADDTTPSRPLADASVPAGDIDGDGDVGADPDGDGSGDGGGDGSDPVRRDEMIPSIERMTDAPLTWFAPMAGDDALVVLAPDAGDGGAATPWRRLTAAGLEDLDFGDLDLGDAAFLSPPDATAGHPAPGDSRHLIAAAGVIYLLDGLTIARTELGDAMELARCDVTRLHSETAGPLRGLWVGCGRGLWRWRDGRLSAIIPYAPGPTPRIIRGPDVGGEPSLWLSSDQGIGALSVGLSLGGDGGGAQNNADNADNADEGDETILWWDERPDLDAQAMVADSEGVLWALVGGELLRRRPDAVWLPTSTETDPEGDLSESSDTDSITQIAASAGAQELWVAAGSGWRHHAAGIWSEVLIPGADVNDSVAGGADGGVDRTGTERGITDASGRLWLGGATGLRRLTPGKTLRLLGISDGAVLEATTRITAEASDSASLSLNDTGGGAEASLTLELVPLDGQQPPMPLLWVRDADGIWAELDHLALDSGRWTLTASARWADEDQMSATVMFAIDHITWTGDVEPVFLSRCAHCHNAIAGVATAVLTSPDDWEPQLQCILCRVEFPNNPGSDACQRCYTATDSMPPDGAIPAREVDLIREWGADGFRR